jgi:transmembrane sensor
MTANHERVRFLITQQAADWYIANRAGLTRKDQSVFAAWLQASPIHIEEYLSVTVIVRDFRAACADSAGSLDELLARARHEQDSPPEPFWPRVTTMPPESAPQGWKVLALAAAVAGILCVGLAAWWSLRPGLADQPMNAAAVLHFATRHGEQQTHTLADRSVLHLNTDSAAGVYYDKAERLVTLTAGEALFEVTHEPDRAFRVLTGSAQIVAVGTEFNVRLLDHATTLVTVLQGAVAAGPSNPRSAMELISVAAGQQILIAADQNPAQPTAADPKRTAAWLHRQIVFEHEPLQRVATEFNRYAPKRIEIVTPALQDLEISGVFATDDVDAFIAFLRSLDGVLVEVTPARISVSLR